MKKVISLLALLILFLGLLAGCASGGTEKGNAEPKEKKDPNAKVSLKMAVFTADEAVFKQG